MKRKVLTIIVFLFAFSIVAVPSLAKITNQYLTSPNYYEKVYQKNPTTHNLLVLCDACLDNNDKKYLLYIDELLNAEDFEQAINEYYGYDKSKILTTKNAFRVATVGVAVVNNDMDDFNDSMKKYYVELESGDRPKYFFKILADVDASFVYENKNAIIQIFYEIAKQEDIPLLKLRELLNILAFYNVTNEKSETIAEVEEEITNVCTQINFNESYEVGLKSIVEEYEEYWADLLSEEQDNQGTVKTAQRQSGDGSVIDTNSDN